AVTPSVAAPSAFARLSLFTTPDRKTNFGLPKTKAAATTGVHGSEVRRQTARLVRTTVTHPRATLTSRMSVTKRWSAPSEGTSWRKRLSPKEPVGTGANERGPSWRK